MLNLFQFTHPVWGATDGRKQNDRRFYVSIHAPRVGCDGMSDGGVIEVKRFQFTHPVWGATWHSGGGSRPVACFNSRTPCGVRLSSSMTYAQIHNVSIHAPRVGCDRSRLILTDVGGVSIHAPRVGCDLICKPIKQNYYVSIHAPRVGCDMTAPA